MGRAHSCKPWRGQKLLLRSGRIVFDVQRYLLGEGETPPWGSRTVDFPKGRPPGCPPGTPRSPPGEAETPSRGSRIVLVPPQPPPGPRVGGPRPLPGDVEQYSTSKSVSPGAPMGPPQDPTRGGRDPFPRSSKIIRVPEVASAEGPRPPLPVKSNRILLRKASPSGAPPLLVLLSP